MSLNKVVAVFLDKDSTKIENNEYELVITADIAPKWSLYSQHLKEGGAYPTEFIFSNADSNFTLLGEVRSRCISSL